jgi:monofunctional biosynthetic peptidoglycan transglycosylase
MIRKILRISVKIIIWFFIISVSWVMLYRFVPVPFTMLMISSSIEQKIDGKEFRLRKDWVSFDELPNTLQLAVVASEDQNFLNHSGFDFEAIDKAIEYNKKQQTKKRPKTRGASTISQQTAKNVFLWPSRNFIRKGFEVYFTFLIELLWSKERIMTCYLNVIEMGEGIYGAEAASQYYFHKSALQLSNREAALIAAVLPNPIKYNAGKPSAYILKRQAWILSQMNNLGGKLNYSVEEKKE